MSHSNIVHYNPTIRDWFFGNPELKKLRKISCGNPEFLAFSCDRQTFLLIHVVTLTFQLFHVVDWKEFFLLTLRYFQWQIFQKKNVVITQINHIFRNPIEISTWFNQKLYILFITWKNWKLKLPTQTAQKLMKKPKT